MDHAQIVLAGILPTDKDRLLLATAQLDNEHFRTAVHRVIFEALSRYFDSTGGVLTKAALVEMLNRGPIDKAKIPLFEEIFQSACQTPITDHEFKFSMQCLKDDLEAQHTGELVTEAYEILEVGKKIDGKDVKGHKDVKQFLYEGLGKLDKLSGFAASAPEGDMRVETADILEAYYKAKSGETISGTTIGIPSYDEASGGVAKGELMLVAAFTNEGKSQLCSQMAWHVAINEGKNFYYGTTETQRDTIKRRIVARHSLLPMFEYPHGLDSKAIQMGTLTPAEEKVLANVLEDLAYNSKYGKMMVSQIPRGATMSYVEARMKRCHQQWPVEFAIWDYLNLIKPDVKRTSAREEANDLLKDAKTISTSFDDGGGVPFVSPWQMSREAWAKAQQSGFYEMASLSDTSEAEKTPDSILALLRFPDSPKKAKLQTLKLRDGAFPPTVELDVDYRCAYLGSSSHDSFSSLPDLGAFGGGF